MQYIWYRCRNGEKSTLSSLTPIPFACHSFASSRHTRTWPPAPSTLTNRTPTPLPAFFMSSFVVPSISRHQVDEYTLPSERGKSHQNEVKPWIYSAIDRISHSTMWIIATLSSCVYFRCLSLVSIGKWRRQAAPALWWPRFRTWCGTKSKVEPGVAKPLMSNHDYNIDASTIVGKPT